jgi:DNA-binding transcriptional ArsR family regulator
MVADMTGPTALNALGDPTRRQIVAFLAQREAPVSVIAGEFPMSQPGISQHLKVLRNAGLVRVRPRAQQRLYSVNGEALAQAGLWMLQMAGFWGERLGALEAQLLAKRTKD